MSTAVYPRAAALSASGRHLFPPGPVNYPAVGNLPFLTGDGLAKLRAWAREYGDIFYYRSFYIHICCLNRPEYIEDVLVTNNHRFIHGMGIQANPRFLGKGLLTSEGKSWRRQRHLMQPAFHQRSVERYAALMVERTESLLETWKDGQGLDLYRSMTRLTLDIVSRVLFDADIAGQIDKVAAAVRAVQLRNARGQSMVYAFKYFPTPRNLRYLWTIHRLEKIVYRIIRQRRESGRYGDDLLSMLLEARDEDGQPMSDRQIRDEVMTLIGAGYDTTALTISYAWYLLAQHPEAEARLRNELGEVLGGRAPRVEDLARLPYLLKVIKETLRLYPPAWAFVREATEDFEIGGYRLPKRTSFVMSPWITHRDPRYYEQPDEFRPERWTEDFESQLPKFAYFPFGGGQRKCIGSNFAKMEAALILAAMAQKFRMRLAPGFRLEMLPCINLQPRNGIRMVLERRPESVGSHPRASVRGEVPQEETRSASGPSRCPFARLFS